MQTTRTTVGEIKAAAREFYEDGRYLGLSHSEAVQRAVTLTGSATCAVEEWVELSRLRYQRAEHGHWLGQ